MENYNVYYINFNFVKICWYFLSDICSSFGQCPCIREKDSLVTLLSFGNDPTVTRQKCYQISTKYNPWTNNNYTLHNPHLTFKFRQPYKVAFENDVEGWGGVESTLQCIFLMAPLKSDIFGNNLFTFRDPRVKLGIYKGVLSIKIAFV